MATLLQSTVGGSATGSVVSNGTLTTSAAGFANSTTAGSMLICLIWVTNIGGGGISLTAPPAVGGGYSGSFTSPNNCFWKNNFDQQDFFFYRINNALSMSPAQTITVIAKNVGINTGTLSVEFHLYEFGAMPSVEVIDANVTVSHSNILSNSTPATTFSATAANDLIITAMCAGDPGTNITAGSGYTLGLNTTVAVTGQMQYQLNATAGQTASSFTGVEPYWGCVTVAFQTTPAPTIATVSPSNGTTAGGTAVTLTGTGFLAGATVSFGGSAATSVVVVSPTSITCVTPAHAAGTVTVSVTDSNGTGNLGNGYTYVQPAPPPPTQGPIRALTQVDTWELDNSSAHWPTDRDVPIAWWETTLPQQQLAIAKAPSNNGSIGLLYVALAQTLTGAGVAFAVPDDWTPYILYGTLAELLSSDGASFDPVRAGYCSQRYQEGIELARIILGGM